MTEYGGRTKEVKGKIIDVTEKNDHDYEVIAEYYPQEYYLETKLYTQKFIVRREIPAAIPKNRQAAETQAAETPAAAARSCFSGQVRAVRRSVLP